MDTRASEKRKPDDGLAGDAPAPKLAKTYDAGDDGAEANMSAEPFYDWPWPRPSSFECNDGCAGLPGKAVLELHTGLVPLAVDVIASYVDFKDSGVSRSASGNQA